MRRAGIRIANVALFTLCCFLVASLFNNISAEFLMIARAANQPLPEVESQRVRGWEERKPIIERNLFGAQVVAAPVSLAPVPEEDLEETRLPLRLLGTVTSGNPAASRATIEDKNTRKHEVVQTGDHLEAHDQVQVAAIERGRVILRNQDRREELRLHEDMGAKKAPAPKRATRRGRSRRSRRSDSALGSLTERLSELQSRGGQGRTPADLLKQGKLKPEYSGDGEMVGMQVNEIKPESLYEKVGLKDGDIITSVNGIAIDNGAAGGKILAQFTRAKEFEIELQDRTITIDADELIRLFEE